MGSCQNMWKSEKHCTLWEVATRKVKKFNTSISGSDYWLSLERISGWPRRTSQYLLVHARVQRRKIHASSSYTFQKPRIMSSRIGRRHLFRLMQVMWIKRLSHLRYLRLQRSLHNTIQYEIPCGNHVVQQFPTKRGFIWKSTCLPSWKYLIRYITLST